MAKILVTGGAGYVGSHGVRALTAAGHEVVVLDDLSQGHADAIAAPLIVADLRDRSAVRAALAGVDVVVHFAALMSVGESVSDPIRYFDVNVAGTLSLLASMGEVGCRRIVFSSTCAVHGVPPTTPLHEDLPFAPISPYGETKATVERILSLGRAQGALSATCLRYFNAAGASLDGWIGEAHHPETHLIPLALDAAATGGTMRVFGTDHPTPDGTCVRDYVHVEDLAHAHVLAVQQLLEGSPGSAWNLGTGHGASVREVLDAVEAITERPLTVVDAPRRPGDPPALVADASRAAAELGWVPVHDLTTIVRTAWQWYQHRRF